MNNTSMDSAAISSRANLTVIEDNVAVESSKFFLPDSIVFGRPGAQASAAPKSERIAAALGAARTQLNEALAARDTARIELARAVLLGSNGSESRMAAARERVAFAADLVAGLEVLAEREGA